MSEKDRSRGFPLINEKTLIGDLASDWIQADKVIMWGVRADGLLPQINMRGVTLEEAEYIFLACASDLHKHRTGQHNGAVIIEDGENSALLNTLDFGQQFSSGKLQGLRSRLRKLYEEKMVR